MSAEPQRSRSRRDSRSVSIEKLQKLQKIRNKVRRDSFARYQGVAPPPLPNAAIMSALTGAKEIPASLPPAPPPPPLPFEHKFEEEESKDDFEPSEVETKREAKTDMAQSVKPPIGIVHKLALYVLSGCFRALIQRIKRSSFQRWKKASRHRHRSQRNGALQLLWRFRERQQMFWQKKAVWRILEASSQASALQEEVSRHIRKELDAPVPEEELRPESVAEEVAVESEGVLVTEGQLQATAVRFMFYRWKIWHQSRVVEVLMKRESATREKVINRLSEINKRCQALEHNSYAAHIVQATTTSRWEKARSLGHRPEVG